VRQLLSAPATGTLTTLRGLGHLAHEEQPQAVAELLLRLLDAGVEPAR
jgi:pimeloyl-ACP methyl ester carboxylesterase